MEIKLERIIVREFKIIDIDDVHEYASDLDTVKYMLFGPNTYEETKSFIETVVNVYNKEENKKVYEFAIEYKGKVIGATSIYLDENNVGELGWILNKKYRRNGFMYEAVSSVINYIKNNTNIKKLIAHCDSRNVPSYKLMEKLGMTRISLVKNCRKDKKTGEYIFDELMYELVLGD